MGPPKLALDRHLCTVLGVLACTGLPGTTLASAGAEASGGGPAVGPTPAVEVRRWQAVGPGSADGGGISDDAQWSRQAALAVAPDGTPLVAWVNDWGYGAEIFVRRFDGAAWVEVGSGSASGGGISSSGLFAYYPSLAIAPDGTPYVAWQAGDHRGSQIHVRRWTGNAWDEVGAGSAGAEGISRSTGFAAAPSLAFAADGTPCVAWFDDRTGASEIYARRFTGVEWEELGDGSADGGGISGTPGQSTYPSLAAAPDGTLLVAWTDDSSGRDEVYLRRWIGTGWEEVGPGSATGGGMSGRSAFAGHPSVAVAPDGTPWVAWYEESDGVAQIRARSWDGASWHDRPTGIVGDVGDCCHAAWPGYLTLVVAPNGVPYLAWNGDGDGRGFDINVLSFRDGAWREAGPGSASGGGISRNPGLSAMPSLAFAPDGAGHVAWEDWSDGSVGEIYVRRDPEPVIWER